MKIIQHADCFEVRAERGSVVKRFPFDDNSRRRAIPRRMTRKQAFQAAKIVGGKSYTVETPKQQDWTFADALSTRSRIPSVLISLIRPSSATRAKEKPAEGNRLHRPGNGTRAL